MHRIILEIRRRLSFLFSRRYEILAKVTSDCLFDWNIQTDRVWRCETNGSFLGHCIKQIRFDRQWWRQCVHPDDYRLVCEELENCFKSKHEQWSCEYRFKHKEGHFAQVLDRGRVIYSRKGEPKRLVGTMLDISQTHRLRVNMEKERKLRVSGLVIL